MSKKNYIGSQEILREEPLEKDIVQVVLKANQDEYPGLGEEEFVCYHSSVLEELRTEEPNEDLNQMRVIRCRKPISEVIYVLLANAVKIDDLEHVFNSALNSIKQADLRQRRSVFGVSEENENTYQFKKELLKE